MLSVFRDIKGHIIINFLEKSTMVNSGSYCQLLRQKSPYSLNDPLVYCIANRSDLFFSRWVNFYFIIYIYIYIYICVYSYTHTHKTHTHRHTHIHTYVHTYIHIYIYIYGCGNVKLCMRKILVAPFTDWRRHIEGNIINSLIYISTTKTPALFFYF